MGSRAVALLCLLVPLALGACRTAPIYNPSGIPLEAPAGTSLAEISKVIQRAGIGLGWQMTEVGPGQIRAVLDKRSHRAEALVQFDTSTFSITYQSSENLMQEDGSIHKGYNRWIQNLEQRIVREARILAVSP